MAELAFHKKRGVVKASLTKLRTKLTDLEGDTTIPTLMESARNLADKQDFKTHQLAIMDRTNEEDALADEQQVLDDNDDQVSELSVFIQRLITLATKSKSPDIARVANRQLTLLQAKLESTDTAIHDLDDTEEDIACILERYGDQVTEIKAKLTALESSLLNSDIPTDDPVMQNQAQLDKAAFDCQLRIKKRLRALITTPTKASETTATKLPKLELPTFHGDILQWKNFWEQFCVSVHDRATIPKEEKLMAQAAEASAEKKHVSKPVNSMVISTMPTNNCISCGLEKHQLYSCAKFRSLSHAEKMNLLRSKNYCLNCLRPGHFVKKCRLLNHCKLCQRPHHTLLHQEKEDAAAKSITPDATTTTSESTTMHVSVSSNILLMTCQVMVETPQGMIKTRALLDKGSSASFVTECLAQTLHLRRFTQDARICGIAGIPHSLESKQ